MVNNALSVNLKVGRFGGLRPECWICYIPNWKILGIPAKVSGKPGSEAGVVQGEL